MERALEQRPPSSRAADGLRGPAHRPPHRRGTSARRHLSYERDAIDQLNLFRAAFEFPILDRGQIRNDVLQQRASAAQNEAKLAGVRLKIGQDVHTSSPPCGNSRASSSVFRADVLEPSEELMRMADLGYREGSTACCRSSKPSARCGTREPTT